MVNLINVLTLGVLLGGIYALVSVGLNLIFGVIRIVNFAQGEFVMLGMYGAFVVGLALQLDPYTSIIVVVPALFVLGAIVQWVLLRPLQNEPMMQVFTTFGLLMILQNVVLAITKGVATNVTMNFASTTVSIGPIQVSLVRVVILIAATAVTLALGLFLKLTMVGKSIRAVAQDRRAAEIVGIDVQRTFLLTFATGIALSGLAGCLLSPLYTLSPQIGTNFIMPAFAVVVLGGLGSVRGAYVGGFLVGLTEAIAGFYIDPALKHAVLFIVFIVVLLVRPSGLFGHAGAEEVGLREQS